MKTAFVTGGSGFVGRNLLPELVKQGYKVKALARSEDAKKLVESLGAVAIIGDLFKKDSLLEGCSGCEFVIHLAASVSFDAKLEDQRKANVQGTINILQAAKETNVTHHNFRNNDLEKVKRFIHCSTESVLLGGKALVNADETWPYPEKNAGAYAKTKAEAEREVRKFSGIETVIVRPRLIWGKGEILERVNSKKGDTVVLSEVAKKVKEGKMMWIAGGTHLTSTCHVRNAAERGKSGEIYFLKDEKNISVKEFFSRYVGTQGIDTSGVRSAPYWLARIAAFLGQIPVPALKLLGEECTVNDSKARKELGYESRVSLQEGLKELTESK